MQIKTKAVVLKSSDYNENDKLLVLLSKDHGIIYAYAPGARKMKSKIFPVSSMLVYGEFILFKNKDNYVVDSAEPEVIFYGIRENLELLSYASYFCELTIGVITEEETSDDVFRLLVNTFYYLDNKKNPEMLKAVYEMRLMSLIGFSPNLVACNECGEYQKNFFYFNLEEGIAICNDCYSSNKGELKLSRSAFMALRHIVYAPIEKLFAFTVSDSVCSEISRTSERYCKVHIDKNFTTLDFLNSIKSS